MSVDRWHQVQQFLFHEARLLDERRLKEWLALYAEDAEYWVPYAWDQQSPKDHVSLYYETKQLLGMRVDRLEGHVSPLDSPIARTNPHPSYASVDGDEARPYLLYVAKSREEQRTFAARCTWRLRAHGESFLIAAKRVDLLNADQDGGHLRFAVPF